MSKRPRAGTAGKPKPAGEPTSPSPLGPNLRRLRSKRGLSLERLARRSGVSRAMLSQIELGKSAPTINLLWKIARALEVPFSGLIDRPSEGAPVILPANTGRLLTNQDGSFTSRALFPIDDQRHRSEFYELRLKGNGEEEANPHPPGTSENLIVTAGAIDVEVDHVSHPLQVGDAIVFAADVPHRYKNLGGSEAVMYLVMTYAESLR